MWEASPGRFASEAFRTALWSVLSADERSRHDRFVFDRDRHVFLVAHAMLRHVLAGYLGRAPADVALVAPPGGRPELESQPPPLRFSLSHAAGLVACAVTRRLDCGVDVEDVARDVALDAVAARMFAPDELVALAALPPDLRRERFFALWTLKESVSKALGRGLRLSFSGFSIDVDTPRGDVLHPSCLVGPGPWWLRRWRPSERHRAALAVGGPTGPGGMVLRRRSWEGPVA